MLLGKGSSGPSQATDERGRARFESVPPGLYDLRVFALGLAEVRREVDVLRGRVLELGTIELERAVHIRGRALVDDDRGLEVEIRMALVPEPGERPDFGNHYATSQADGTFGLGTLPPGRWLLQIKDRQSGRLDGHAADWMAPNVIVDSRHGPVEELRIRLERVAYLVASWTGADHEGVRLRFLDADGLQRQVGGFYGAGPVRVALYPGAWRVLAVDEEGTTLCERSFELGAEDLRLALSPGG